MLTKDTKKRVINKLGALALMVILSLALFSCMFDQKGSIDQPVAPPVINIPPSQTVDTTELRQGVKDDITASSNAMANQMTGAVNAPIAKLAEKLTGLEATIRAEISNTLTSNNQVSAELRAKLEAILTIMAEINVTFKMITEFNTNIDAKLSADASLVRELHAKVDTLNAQVAGMANGQVGLSNKMDSTIANLTAGRDVNQMPKETVEVMLGSYRMLMYIIGGMLSALTTIAGYAYRNARNREEQQAQILMKALAQLQPESAKSLAEEHAAKRALL